jgi:hypothetical protein
MGFLIQPNHTEWAESLLEHKYVSCCQYEEKGGGTSPWVNVSLQF